MDIRVAHEKEEKEWRFVGFYGLPNVSDRHVSWQMLKGLQQEDDSTWLIGGDFNEILTVEEKIGGPPRANWPMEAFKEAVEFCGLQDL